MFKHLFAVALALAPLGASAQDRGDLAMVWYTTHGCPPTEAGAAGSSPENPIALDGFYDPIHAAERDPDAEAPPPPSAFECKWVRLAGFVTWMDYYHYRGALFESASAAYVAGNARYIIENFTDPNARRAVVAQRQVTLVGRFYDLCAAAERAERQAGQTWWLFGPCHYGADRGMMLGDVRVENIHDRLPQYLVGERNRMIVGQLPRVEGPDRAGLIEATRAWAALVSEGPAAYADAHFAAHPTLREQSAEEQREARASIESADGYIAYANERLARLSMRRPPVEVFWRNAYSSTRDEAVGCVCLQRSCDDDWPLAAGDARSFLGAAVCTELDRTEEGWRW